MNRRLALVLSVALVVGGIVSLFDAEFAASATHVAPLTASQASIARATLVCPQFGGNANNTRTVLATSVLSGTGKVSWTRLPKPAFRPLLTSGPQSTFMSSIATTTPVVLSADGTVAGYLSAEQMRRTDGGVNRGIADAYCTTPGVSQWFAGGSTAVGHTTQLLLTNPSSVPAAVDVTVYTKDGPQQPRAAQGVAVPPFTQLVIDVGSIAPAEPAVAVHVAARQGRVAMAMWASERNGGIARGIEYVGPAGAPSRHVVLPGVPKTGGRLLLVANPSGQDATVSVRLVTDGGTFTPTNPHTLTIPAGTVHFVGIGNAFGSSQGAVVLSSDQPIVAVVGVVAGGVAGIADIGLAAAAQPVTAPVALPLIPLSSDTTNQIQITSPDHPSVVRVDLRDATGRVAWSRTSRIAAGYTATVALPTALRNSAALTAVLTPVQGTFYAARVVTEQGAHGPLFSIVAVMPMTSTVRSPAVKADDSAALNVGF